MAKKGKGSGGKKEPVAKKHQKLNELFTISGGSIERRNRSCPKCGPGVFLAKHKNRVVCGKCQYVEYASKAPAKKEEPSSEEKPAKEEKETEPKSEETKEAEPKAE